jgi:glycosyltransferase involved in cell wall biosynthesis
VRAALQWTDDAPVIGFVGRFLPEKGLAVLMAALDQLAQPWRALIVGSGPLEPQVRAWAAKHATRVAIHTGVAHHDVPRWLNAMDLLCAPSLTQAGWREQFGRMLIEAFACGVPVVASDSGEIPYVVGSAGVIVPEGDVARWREAIRTLIDGADLRTAFARRGRERALAVFDWGVIARQHSSFFDEVIAGALPARGCAA